MYVDKKSSKTELISATYIQDKVKYTPKERSNGISRHSDSVNCRAFDLISPISSKKLGFREIQSWKKHSFVKDHKLFSETETPIYSLIMKTLFKKIIAHTDTKKF